RLILQPLIPYYSSFSLPPAPPPPHPPPFPTRRSSDLTSAPSSPPRAAPACSPSTPTAIGCNASSRSSPRATTNASPPGRGLEEADRKSTRLNSSHEWISYAVFCLKKKKT